MLIKQISIFIENRKGRLSAVTRLLKKNNINLRALSIADTQDFGIIRIIVDDPYRICEVLRDAGTAFTMTDVIGVEIADTPGSLSDVMDLLEENDISIEYLYSFLSVPLTKGFVVIRVEDNQKTIKILQENGIAILDPDVVYSK